MLDTLQFAIKKGLTSPLKWTHTSSLPGPLKWVLQMFVARQIRDLEPLDYTHII